MGLSRNKVAVGESAAGSPPNAAHKRVLCFYRLETEKLLRHKIRGPYETTTRARRSVGRSLPLQGRGPGFESQRVHKDSGLKSGESLTISKPRTKVRGLERKQTPHFNAGYQCTQRCNAAAEG